MNTWDCIEWGNGSADVSINAMSDLTRSLRSSFSSARSSSTIDGEVIPDPPSPQKNVSSHAGKRSSWFDNMFEEDNENEALHQKPSNVFPIAFKRSSLVPLEDESAKKIVHRRRSDFIVDWPDQKTQPRSHGRATRNRSWFVAENKERIHPTEHAKPLNAVSRTLKRSSLVPLESEMITAHSESTIKAFRWSDRRSSGFALMDFVDKAVKVLVHEEFDDDLEVPFPSSPRGR